MEEFRSLCPYSFKQLEYTLLRKLGEAFAQVLAEVLWQYDCLIMERRPERFQVKQVRSRTIETLLGVPVVYQRRLYYDREERRYVYLLDEVLGLEANETISPGLREAVVTLGVECSSYRQAAKALAGIYQHPVVSHETIRRSVIAVGQITAAAEERQRAISSGSRRVPMLFLEVDGIYEHLQRDRQKFVEERVLIGHEGWEADGKRRRLRNKITFRSQAASGEEFWEVASEHLYSLYDLDEQTLVIINGDRAGWIRQGQKYFPNALYQVDRFHLVRELVRIFGVANKKVLREIFRVIDKDPTGQAFLEALERHRDKVAKEKLGAFDALVNDLRPIAECVCDYRVRLRAKGQSTEGLYGMGAAESQMSCLADRTKHRRQSWSRVGLASLMQLLCAKLAGKLEAVIRASKGVLVELAEVEERIEEAKREVVESMREESPGIKQSHPPILDAGRGRSGGLARVLFDLAHASSF